jgi:hypothetical protein
MVVLALVHYLNKPLLLQALKEAEGSLTGRGVVCPSGNEVSALRRLVVGGESLDVDSLGQQELATRSG